MKTTLAVSTLLLVAASAQPLLNEEPILILDPETQQHPILVLNPMEADSVYELEPSLLQELIWRQSAEPEVMVDEVDEPSQDPEFDEESGHERKKRQTTVSGSVNRERIGG